MTPKKFSVYKPNKRLAGAAFQFDFNPSKESVFVEAANQTGEQQFDWTNKIIVKLSGTDLAKLVLVLEGKKPSVELFHDSTKIAKLLTESVSSTQTNSLSKATSVTLKSTTLTLTKGDYGFFLRATRQFSDGKLNTVNMPLGDDEAVTLRILLQHTITRIYGW